MWKSSYSLINLEDRLAECDNEGAGNMVSGNTQLEQEEEEEKNTKKMGVERSASGGVAG